MSGAAATAMADSFDSSASGRFRRHPSCGRRRPHPSDAARTLPLQFAVRIVQACGGHGAIREAEQGDGDGREPGSVRRAVAAPARGRGAVPGGAGRAGRAERAGDRGAGDGQAAAAVSPHRRGAGGCARAHRAGARGAGGGAGTSPRSARSARARPPLPRRRAPARRPGGGRAGASSPCCRPGRTGC